MPKYKNPVKLKVTSRIKKYPKGAAKEDIDEGKVKPYYDKTKECTIHANDRRV